MFQNIDCWSNVTVLTYMQVSNWAVERLMLLVSYPGKVEVWLVVASHAVVGDLQLLGRLHVQPGGFADPAGR